MGNMDTNSSVGGTSLAPSSLPSTSIAPSHCDDRQAPPSLASEQAPSFRHKPSDPFGRSSAQSIGDLQSLAGGDQPFSRDPHVPVPRPERPDGAPPGGREPLRVGDDTLSDHSGQMNRFPKNRQVGATTPILSFSTCSLIHLHLIE
jgi:hypothetical protein